MLINWFLGKKVKYILLEIKASATLHTIHLTLDLIRKSATVRVNAKGQKARSTIDSKGYGILNKQLYDDYKWQGDINLM